MADFQNRLISRILGVLSSGFFLHRTTVMFLLVGFGMLLASLILTQTDHFANAITFLWAIAFGRWPIFKVFSFLEYWVFFRAVFWTKQL